jgi:type VI secretion system secreted protein Hcp
MALNAYLRMKGQKQGDIKGSVTQKGREGKIMVIAVSHDIMSPRDPAPGLAAGKRQHKPFVITKELDKSTPLLYNALVNNENIIEWELQFWTPAPNGIEKQHYTVKLTNATPPRFHAQHQTSGFGEARRIRKSRSPTRKSSGSGSMARSRPPTNEPASSERGAHSVTANRPLTDSPT